MKYKSDVDIKISCKADENEINTVAKGCEADVLDVLAKVTVSILRNTSICGLNGKELLDAYIAFLTHLYTKDLPVEETCIRIPARAFLGGAQD